VVLPLRATRYSRPAALVSTTYREPSPAASTSQGSENRCFTDPSRLPSASRWITRCMLASTTWTVPSCATSIPRGAPRSAQISTWPVFRSILLTWASPVSATRSRPSEMAPLLRRGRCPHRPEPPNSCGPRRRAAAATFRRIGRRRRMVRVPRRRLPRLARSPRSCRWRGRPGSHGPCRSGRRPRPARGTRWTAHRPRWATRRSAEPSEREPSRTAHEFRPLARRRSSVPPSERRCVPGRAGAFVGNWFLEPTPEEADALAERLVEIVQELRTRPAPDQRPAPTARSIRSASSPGSSEGNGFGGARPA
jgi:hypothetical protein